jgi:hypothetical protein
MQLVRGYQGSVPAVAKHLGWPLVKVQAAVYYAEAFPKEINETMADFPTTASPAHRVEYVAGIATGTHSGGNTNYEYRSKGGTEFKLAAQLDSADTLAAYTSLGSVLFHRQRPTTNRNTQWYRHRSNGRQNSGRNRDDCERRHGR